MRPRFGRLGSAVLGLDLLIQDGRLRFYYGDAELPDSEEFIARIESLGDDIQRRREEAEARAEAEASRAEQEAERAQQSLAMQRETVLDILSARGLEADDATCALVRACSDSTQLRRWATRAATATTIAEVLSA